MSTTLVLARVEKALETHFKLVGHPLEAPAKTSHGDVDVLVVEPANQNILPGKPMGDFLIGLLGAKVWKKMGGSSTYNIALPWPGRFGDSVVKVVGASEATKLPKEDQGGGEMKDVINSGVKIGSLSSPPSKATSQWERYIQVDINIMPAPADFDWHMFFHAHGDLWNMLGGIIRRFGLTASSKGLCIRIEEVETHNKEQARVRASADPNTVLQYLGLDADRYDRPFDSWDEMLAYVASCRFHDPARWKTRYQNEEDEDAETKPDIEQEEKSPNKPTNRLLKANDRQRAAKRPLFGYWIETYLPAHVDDRPGKSAFLSREEVLDDAKEFFGTDFATRFEDRKRKMIRQIGVDQLWADIRKMLPIEGTEVGYVMKGMKSEIVGQKTNMLAEEEMLQGLEEARKAYEDSRFEEVLDWAKAHWKVVGERQKLKDQEQSQIHLQAKKKRDKS